MSFLQCPPLPLQIRSISSPSRISLSPNPNFFPTFPSRIHIRKLHVLSPSSSNSGPLTEQEIIEAVSDSDEKSRPCVRSYENNLARLTLVGAVDLEQALTAAAADGGEAAGEHIDSGVQAMVVETVYPGSCGEHSTVSTRLFLPARKVKEKAKKLKTYVTEDMLKSSTSRNILAMTFRQVVLQQLWSFDLMMFRPGTLRNMEDLENPREVPASFTLSSSDQRVISVLAEVVCLSALESTENYFFNGPDGKTSNNFFHWFHKSKRIVSTDSSIILFKLLEDEMVQNAKSLLKNYKSAKASFRFMGNKSKFCWWTSSALSKLERIGGPEFSTWASEYVPAYRLQIDAHKLKNVKFEGWKISGEHLWEVLLTHSQMVELANIIDMFYEDLFTIPEKKLSCGTAGSSTTLSKNKRSLSKILFITLASGIFLLTISILGQHSVPYLSKRKNYASNHQSVPSSAIDFMQHHSLEANKLEAFCISTVEKVKDGLGWSGDIAKDASFGAWTGELPIYLKKMMENKSIGDTDENSTSSFPLESNNVEDIAGSAEDIASYQVVFTIDGKIIGFQPTSQVAVNHWAKNPLATELYGGRKLSPGLLEPGLKIPHPNEVVTIELLMSTNPLNSFALARPIQ